MIRKGKGRIIYIPESKCFPIGRGSFPVWLQFLLVVLVTSASGCVIYIVLHDMPNVESFWERVYLTFFYLVCLPLINLFVIWAIPFSVDRLWTEGIEIFGGWKEGFLRKRTFYRFRDMEKAEVVFDKKGRINAIIIYERKHKYPLDLTIECYDREYLEIVRSTLLKRGIKVEEKNVSSSKSEIHSV